MKLNLGCGRSRLDGYVNVDRVKTDAVDVVCDLDGFALKSHFAEGSVSESVGVHLLEHLANPLAFAEALWHVTEPGGTVTFELPYGTSDDAWEDPTHARPYFMNSFGYFGQPNYFRADYNYRGDWRVLSVTLAVDRARWAGVDPAEIGRAVRGERNVVRVMHAQLECVKPARQPLAELREPTPVGFALV